MTTPEQVFRAAQLVRKTCDLTGVPQEQVHRLVDAAEAAVCAIDLRSAAWDAYEAAARQADERAKVYRLLRHELGMRAIPASAVIG